MPNLDPKLYPEQLINFGNLSGCFLTIASCYWPRKLAFALNRWFFFDFGQLVLHNYWMDKAKDFSVEPWSPKNALRRHGGYQ